MALAPSVREHITSTLAAHRVVLFMKGTRRMPQCGFSAQVVQALDEFLPEYETVDVLRSPELRDGIKEFSSWPTIPQLYVDGRFVGGSDIVRELRASGELEKLLGVTAREVPRPTVTLTEGAAAAFRAALSDAQGDVLRLSVTPRFDHDLFFGPRQAGDVEIDAGGIALFLDHESARRADGIAIDFVDGDRGGFKLDNPNQPAGVKKISVTEAKGRMDRGELTLFDVRPEAERALASIPGAHALDEAGRARLAELARDAPIAFYCHHGVRSRGVADQAVREGYKNVHNLEGGIDAWSLAVDASVPRY